MKAFENDAAILAQYVATFEKLGDLRELASERDITEEVFRSLMQGTTEIAWKEWHPQAYETEVSELLKFYQALGLLGRGSTRFPPLYETLLLSYRWSEVDLGRYRLLANKFSLDLSPLSGCIRESSALFSTLRSNGYWQFGRAESDDFDPVCFDFRHRQKNGDCRIVRIDHEDIFCRYHIREVEELAPNFRSLVLDTIQRANSL